MEKRKGRRCYSCCEMGHLASQCSQHDSAVLSEPKIQQLQQQLKDQQHSLEEVSECVAELKFEKSELVMNLEKQCYDVKQLRGQLSVEIRRNEDMQRGAKMLIESLQEEIQHREKEAQDLTNAWRSKMTGLKTENQGLKDKVQGLIKRERKEVVGREQYCNAYKLQLEKMTQECEDLNAMLSSTQTSQQELSKMWDNTVKVKHTEDELSENGSIMDTVQGVHTTEFTAVPHNNESTYVGARETGQGHVFPNSLSKSSFENSIDSEGESGFGDDDDDQCVCWV
jgi:Rad3-related DNA helicase